MADVSQFRLGAVRKLIEQVPDGTIRSLESVLASGGRDDRSIAMVRDMVNAELQERRLRLAVFAPVLSEEGMGPALLGFPADATVLSWRALKIAEPDLLERAARLDARRQREAAPPPEFDQICAKVAEALRTGHPEFEPLSQRLAEAGPGCRDRFILCLALAPLVRTTLPKLPVWVRTLSKDYAAAIRLAFRDATAINEDAGPAFMELLYHHLEEGWQVLRLISLVMDRPTDRYLAASELAGFAERLLDDVDRRIAQVRDFKADRGLEGGVEVAASVLTAVTIIAEFDQWLDVSRDGTWGRRLAHQKRGLALAAEVRLREMEDAVNRALPVHSVRVGARTLRGAPNLGSDLNPQAVRRAQALMAFLYDTRNSASHGGFGAMRAKVVEALDTRLDQYAEDLLDMLHDHGEQQERVRAHLEVAAELLALVREPAAGEIVRRRAAVA